jgi:DNA-binding transcriptional MerR regulator
MAASAQYSAEPERLYRIGDVSRLTDTKPFVLRFWETEFPMLQPVKTPKGHRLYRQQDIDLILAIKRLLYHEGFTIPGARRHLAEQASAPPPGADELPAAEPQMQPALFAAERPLIPPPVAEISALTPSQADLLRAVRDEVRAILTLLGAG